MTRRVFGRDNELASIDDLVDRTAAGNGAVLYVHGPSGIGKSCLIEQLIARASLRGVLTTLTAAEATRRGEPLSVFRTLMRGTETATDDPETEVVLDMIEKLCAGRPTLLVVEDAHWADRNSLAALGAIGRRVAEFGLLLAVSARDVPVRPELASVRQLASGGGYDWALQELPAHDVVDLAIARLGTAPSHEVSDLLHSIGGNPFLVHELLDSIERGGFGIRGEHDRLDGELDLRGRIRDRAIASVPLGSTIIPALAVLPTGASVGELAAILDAPFGSILDAVLRGIDVGTLVGSPTGVAFRHDLVRVAVLASTPGGVSHDLLRRAIGSFMTTDANANRLSACLIELASYGEPSDAATISDAARSYQHDRPDLAADLYTEAITLAGGSVDTNVVYELALALTNSGRAGEVGALLDAHFGPFHVDEPIARQRLRGNAGMLAGKLDVLMTNYEALTIDEIQRRYPLTDTEAVDAIAELAELRANAGRPLDALELLEWVDTAPSAPTVSRVITVNETRSLLATLEGRFDDAEALAREAIRYSDGSAGEVVGRAVPRLMRAVALGLLGRDEESLATVRAPLGGPRPYWAGPMLQGFACGALYRMGSWDDALAESDAVIAASEEFDFGIDSLWPYAVKALIAIARGDFDDAQSSLAAANRPDASRAIGREWMATAFVRLLEAQGDATAAANVAAIAVERILAAPAPGMLLNGGADLVRCCLQGGRSDAADAAVAALGTVAGRSSSPIAAGALRWANGLRQNKPELIAEGAAIFANSHRRPEAARSFADAAALAAGSKGGTHVGEWATAAVAGFDDIGAPAVDSWLRSTLKSRGCSIRTPRSTPRPTMGWSSLTPSEARIVQLVGEGSSNGEIAAHLVVSRRTVESHLVRVYAKLGLTSRVQLVAAAARRPDVALAP